ncbi:hypothetical protein BASA81_009978 [Batrachochytrium salamandrivorans]|nr:hypothetical protein BASA81_009978 [Batrachochytrium salamandrivorans]
MLRLADGDSSSTLTHRTVPLQLHIGKHVETVSFYVTSLCHGLLLGYSWLEKHNPRINWVQGWSTLTRLTVWRTVRLGQLDSGTWKTSNSRQNHASEPRTNGALRSGCFDSGEEYFLVLYLRGLDSIHSDVYPFLDASPDSNSSIPDDILKEFTSVFQKQSEKLPIHREFDCTIDLVPKCCSPSWSSLLGLARSLQSSAIKEGDEPKTAFITKYGQFEFLVMPSDLQTPRLSFKG